MRSLWSQQPTRFSRQIGNTNFIYRTMATKDNPTVSTEQPTTINSPSQDLDHAQIHSNDTPLPLPPPSSEEDVSKLDMSTGEATVKMNALGPLVVNQDGSLSRIDNWSQMTELEKKNTLRVIGKRNQARREALKAKDEDREGDGNA